jgi:hypothetical protein
MNVLFHTKLPRKIATSTLLELVSVLYNQDLPPDATESGQKRLIPKNSSHHSIGNQTAFPPTPQNHLPSQLQSINQQEIQLRLYLKLFSIVFRTADIKESRKQFEQTFHNNKIFLSGHYVSTVCIQN